MSSPSLADAYARCELLTRSHYENFPVARLVPARLRPHVSAVYAFARTADDIADEGWGLATSPKPSERVATLERYKAELERAFQGSPLLEPDWSWIFTAVHDTARAFDVPVQLFRDLIDAFQQDCVRLSYDTFEEVLDYCRRSANPVGRLVLLLHGKGSEEAFRLSDAICTALQLANFWQDVGVDIRKEGRIYIPREDWPTFGVTREHFNATDTTPDALRRCIAFQCQRTAELFRLGKPLPAQLPFPLNIEIRMTWLGGSRVLEKIQACGFNTLAERPKLNKGDAAALLSRSLFPL